MKKILFLSKDNLTTNPRLQKELKLAAKIGYDVDFVGFYLGNWSDKLDATINKNINADFTYIPATRTPFVKWFFSSAIEKIAQKLYFFFSNSLKINAFGHSKRTIFIKKSINTNKKYDIVIGHTLPTLLPAYIIAQKHKIPLIFDIEDYHPGELIKKDRINEENRRKFLMKKLLPKANYITYASPLIGKYSLDLLDEKVIKHSLINNCFSQNEFIFKENNTEKIKFVWFSQSINEGRGLEIILPALSKFKNKIQITLIGNLNNEFYEKFLKKYSNFIKITPPLSQKKLNLSLSNFDVGLAIEISKIDINKDIALSNKIFSYAQSGLYILATNTKAQKQFIAENEKHGIIVEQNHNNFIEKIEFIIENITKIRENKQIRFENAKKLAWENESEKLIGIWNELLKIKPI